MSRINSCGKNLPTNLYFNFGKKLLKRNYLQDSKVAKITYVRKVTMILPSTAKSLLPKTRNKARIKN